MEWTDIACIVFVCVTANHLGLVSAVEDAIGHRLPVLNCPKCLTFWTTASYGALNVIGALAVLAISFLASYMAIWLELAEGYVDTLYMKLYGKIYITSDNAPAADTDNGDSAGSMPELQ